MWRFGCASFVEYWLRRLRLSARLTKNSLGVQGRFSAVMCPRLQNLQTGS